MFTLAHLSDPHVGPLANPGWRPLASKRAFGYLSWRIRRQPVHQGPVLPALVADLKSQTPDHVAITGDLTNISLPAEFAVAADWLHGVGGPAAVTVVPGNHDAYVAVPWDRSWEHWKHYMSGVESADSDIEVPAASHADFPFVRLRGDVALVGVSTACPTPPRSAAGWIGASQLAALADRLARLGRRGLFRVVLMHHPPLPGLAKRNAQLQDSSAFRSVVERCGAELVLFGHTHKSGLAKLRTPRGHVPAIGVPSASAKPHAGKDHARYHLYRIERSGNAWQVEVEVRGVSRALDGFEREGRFRLAIPC